MPSRGRLRYSGNLFGHIAGETVRLECWGASILILTRWRPISAVSSNYPHYRVEVPTRGMRIAKKSPMRMLRYGRFPNGQ